MKRNVVSVWVAKPSSELATYPADEWFLIWEKSLAFSSKGVKFQLNL